MNLKNNQKIRQLNDKSFNSKTRRHFLFYKNYQSVL